MVFTKQADLINSLKFIAEDFPDMRIGLVGSFARNANVIDSDIDIVLDKMDGTVAEKDVDMFLKAEDKIRSLSSDEWDVLWLSTLKKEQSSYIKTMNALGLDISKEECIYDNIMKDVIWVE